MPQTNHGSIEFLKFPDPQHPGDNSHWVKKWLRDSWARRKILALQQAIAGIVVPTASTANPQMDGTADPGISTDYSRADHVHPSDTDKQDALSALQLSALSELVTVRTASGKTNGNGDFSPFTGYSPHIIAVWSEGNNYVCIPFIYSNGKTYIRILLANASYSPVTNTNVTVQYIALTV